MKRTSKASNSKAKTSRNSFRGKGKVLIYFIIEMDGTYYNLYMKGLPEKKTPLANI